MNTHTVTATALYLTPTERILFDQLPAAVRQAWRGTVEEERSTAWETPDQLLSRASALVKQASPLLKTTTAHIVEKVTSGGINTLSEADVPVEVLPQILYCIGATGMREMIEQGLKTAVQGSDLDGIAGLSAARHCVLMTNSLL